MGMEGTVLQLAHWLPCFGCRAWALFPRLSKASRRAELARRSARRIRQAVHEQTPLFCSTGGRGKIACVSSAPADFQCIQYVPFRQSQGGRHWPGVHLSRLNPPPSVMLSVLQVEPVYISFTATEKFTSARATESIRASEVIFNTPPDQDPYHGPGQAMGLSFSVPRGTKVPSSLVNIFKEIRDDVGATIPSHGNLEKWAHQVIDNNVTMSPRSQIDISLQLLGKGILEMFCMRFY